MSRSPEDPSNGYESVAGDFMSLRSGSRIGIETVSDWANSLPAGGCVLDLGCGHGLPVSKALIDKGLALHVVDASPSMIAAFRARFPEAPAVCEAVGTSRFFGRPFDGVVAIGLVFLLAPDAQALLIRKVGMALRPGGRFLFTAPSQPCAWLDSLTGRRSVSLGAEAYRKLLESEGMVLLGETEDEGNNHYYAACKRHGIGGVHTGPCGADPA